VISTPFDPSAEGPRREDAVLERIVEILGGKGLLKEIRNIGDDCAVLEPFVGQTLVSTDVCVYGVHLDDQIFGVEDLGYKAMTSAISDIAAMGGRVRGALIGVSAPAGTDLELLHYGVADAAAVTGCPVVGGDLTQSNQLAVSVTVLGECPGGGAVLRSGARPGDTLLVTGPLGRSAAGLRRARAGVALNDELVLAHRHPWPRLAEGQAARGASASAMMDLSDGLGLDLHRLADASGVGVELTDLPVAEGATSEEAWSGGEDYELLIATSDPDRLALVFADRGLRAPLVIGRCVQDATSRRYRGADLPRSGYQHSW
jgi:thiamine-monophosphate kinase